MKRVEVMVLLYSILLVELPMVLGRGMQIAVLSPLQ